MRPRVLPLLALLVPGSVRAEECARAVAPDELAAVLDAAEAAFGAVRLDDFLSSADAAALALPCLDAPVPREIAGRYHRLQGLQRFVARDEDATVRAFAAARSAAPGLELPESLIPKGHEVRELYTRFPLETGKTTPLARPARGRVLLDGAEGLARPVEWPTIFQLQDADGAIAASTWLQPRDALPAYTPAPLDPVGGGRRRLKTGLLVTSAATAATSGFLYGLAAASSRAFEQDQPGWTGEDLLAQRYRTNSLVIASAATAGLALTAGGVGLALKVP